MVCDEGPPDDELFWTWSGYESGRTATVIALVMKH